MRLRNIKAISLVLAASMVFTMNNAAFANEIPAEVTEEVVEEAAEILRGLEGHPLDDQPELAALVDGPIVLAGLTDKDRGITYSGDVSTALYQRTEHTYTTYVWKQNNYITKDQPENFELKPLYDVTDETYTVYFTLKEK